MQDISVLIKPASSACNMACSYCFYRDIAAHREREYQGKLSIAKVEQLVQAAMACAQKRCTFAFQGGEPTLAGLDWFRQLLLVQQKYKKPGVQIYNCIQTNGYDLDEAWACFLAENGFLVGVSLDGSPDIHNRNRKNTEQKDTYNRVRRSIELLKRYHVEYNVLSVVTEQSARSIEKIYRHFRKLGIDYMQFIPCLDPWDTAQGSMQYSLQPQTYGRFLIRLFDLWSADIKNGNRVSIRTFDNWLSMLTGYPAEACGMSGKCAIQLVVEGDAGVYPCDFYVLDHWRIGTVGEQTFEEMLCSSKAQAFLAESAAVPAECAECPYYPLCRNGCKRERRKMPDGTYGRHFFCEAFRTFFEARLPQMQNLLQFISFPGVHTR